MVSTDRPRGRRPPVPLAMVVAAAVASLALAAAATEMWPKLDRAYDGLTAPSRSPAERELAPVTSLSIWPELFTRARETLPPDAVYAVVVGNSPPTQPLWHEAIPPLLAYWLLPRRYTPDLHAADWVITFRASSEALGVPIAREIGLGPDGNAVEVAR